MERWTINLENARKFLKEEYPENRSNRTERLSENYLGKRILDLCKRYDRLEAR